MTEVKRFRYPRNQDRILKSAESEISVLYTQAMRERRPHDWIIKRLSFIYKNQAGRISPHNYEKLCHYARGHYDFLSRLLEWKVFHRGEHKLSKEVPDGEWLSVDPKEGAHFYPNSNSRFN